MRLDGLVVPTFTPDDRAEAHHAAGYRAAFRPGVLDYTTYLRALATLPSHTPFMLEHLSPKQYPVAARHLRVVTEQQEISL